MTNAELDAIEARTSLATSGLWTVGYGGHPKGTAKGNNDGTVWTHHNKLGYADEIAVTGGHEANAEFIAHAREDIPALVAEVRRLRAFLRKVRIRDIEGEV